MVWSDMNTFWGKPQHCCLQTVAVALPSEKKVTTLFGTEITFSCNKDSIVSFF